MSNGRRVTGFGAALVVVAVVIVAFVVRPGSAPVPVTGAQAIAIVQAFDPQATGLAVTGTQTLPGGPAFSVESKDVSAVVDVATGRILSFLDFTAMPVPTGAPSATMTGAQALKAATSYLLGHAVSIEGLQPAVEFLDHGDTQEYAVTWTGHIGGVRVPTNVQVSVDPATGNVYGFLQFTRSYASPPTPKLTVDEAAGAARALLRDPGAKVTASDLAIAFDAVGNQILAWQLDLTLSDGFFAKVQVDALTGSSVVTARG